jgi:peptidoglycan/LPS O-acetylase OafA/YrhL
LALRIALAIAQPKNAFGAYTMMLCRMDSLAMGGLIAIAQRERPHWLKKRWFGWMTLFSALTFATVVWWYHNSDPWPIGTRTIGYTALDLMFAGILVMLIAWREPVLLKICRLRVLVWLGTVSYGLYLLHVPAEVIGRRLAALMVKIPPSGSAQFFISMAVALSMAWLSWTLFESPILKLKDRFTVR